MVEIPKSYKIGVDFKYDFENGELQTLINDKVKEVIEVRKTLLDDMLRQAIIYELEKQGYTVISPEVSQKTQGS